MKEAENRVAVLLSEEEKQETAPLRTVYIYVVVMEGCAKTAWYSMAGALDWLMSEFGEHNIHYMHTDDDRYIIGYADGSAMFHISQVPLAASRDE